MSSAPAIGSAAHVGQPQSARLAKGASIALAGMVGGRGIRLVMDALLAHMLGPGMFGLYAIGFAVTRVATFLSPLGLDAGVIRFGSAYWHRDTQRLKSVVVEGFLYSLFSGLVLGAGLYLAAPWLADQMFSKPELAPVFRWFALAFPLITSLHVAAAATRISQRMQFAVYAEEIAQPAAALLLILTLSLWGWKLAGALAANVISFGLSLALAIYYLHLLFPAVLTPPLQVTKCGKDLLGFSLPASLSTMSGILLLWTDRLFVGYFRPASEAGIYYAAGQLSVMLAVILGAFGAIAGPMIAHRHSEGDRLRLQELFHMSTKWSLYLSIPPFLVMALLGGPAMSALFGKPYAEGATALLILAVGQLVNAGTGPTGAMLLMTGHARLISRLTASAVLLSSILCFVLIPRRELVGAALATSLAVSSLAVASVWTIRRTLGVWPYDRRYLKGMAGTGATAAALLLLRVTAVGSPLARLVVGAILAVCVFLTVLILAGLDHEDREFVRLIHARVSRSQ
ncbi:MAG: flippase [Acidobacteriia bacterium]|nr:flippase [Terriglobia bacterium]